MRTKNTRLPSLGMVGSNLSAVVQVPTSDLKPMPGHPWSISQPDVARVTPLLKRFGDRALPVLVNDDNEVISGHVFVEAAKKSGRAVIRVIRQSGLSGPEGLLLGIAVTKAQTLGTWDGQAMEAALRDFETHIEDFSSAMIAFAPGELDKLIGASTFDPTADEVPAVNSIAISRVGSCWICGDHRVICGDATDAMVFEALLDGETAAVAICDPPFGCKVDGFVSKKGKHREFVQASGEKSDSELAVFFENFCAAMSSVLRAGALVYLFIDWRSLSLLQQAAQKIFGKLINLCVWCKDRAGMGSFYRSRHELVLLFSMPGAPYRNNIELGRHGRDRSNIWSYPSAASSRKGREGDMLRDHPTPKPVEMIADAIIDSTLRGDIVLDCFLGSGTALIAADRTGRRFRGMDLDPLYVDLAVRRWQHWTGKEAFDLDTGQSFNDIAKGLEDGE
jgi:DNA modification methylase